MAAGDPLSRLPLRRRLALALAGLALALPTVGCSAEPAADRAFGEKVRAYLMAHPEVIQDALARQQEKEAANASKASAQAVGDQRAKIERDARDPVGGAKAGRVTVTEFFDYRCPYCKVAGPQIPELLKRHPEVRFVYKEFPILSDASERAARLALAAKAQGKYAPVHLAFMSAPQLTDDAMEGVLAALGVDVARARTDAQSPAVTAQLNDIHTLARTLGVTGTPAFVVGDELSNGWSAEAIEAQIDKAAKAGRPPPTAAAAPH